MSTKVRLDREISCSGAFCRGVEGVCWHLKSMWGHPTIVNYEHCDLFDEEIEQGMRCKECLRAEEWYRLAHR